MLKSCFSLLTKKILDTNFHVRGGSVGAGSAIHNAFNNRLFVTVSYEGPLVRLAVDLNFVSIDSET